MKQLPVGATFTASGWISNGISFDDYRAMRTHTSKRRVAGERRLPTPDWAMNNAMLRRVIVRFMEERAFSKKERSSSDHVYHTRLEKELEGRDRRKKETIEDRRLLEEVYLKERLAAAVARVISKRDGAIVILKKLCAEYVEIKNCGLNPNITDKEWNEKKRQPYMPFAEGEARYQDEQKRLRHLETEIEGIDTYLRISENGGADMIAATIYLYYRAGLDSVGVGSDLGLKPPHIRQTIFRLHQTAKRLAEEGAFGVIKRSKQKAAPTHRPKFYTPALFE